MEKQMDIGRNGHHKLEYGDLDKPIYWIGLDDNNEIKKNIFTKYQIKYPNYIKDIEKGVIRYFGDKTRKNAQNKELMTTGGFSMYSLDPINEDDFLKKVLDCLIVRQATLENLKNKTDESLKTINIKLYGNNEKTVPSRTNRDWLESLNNENFADWCINGPSFDFATNKPVQPSPKLQEIAHSYNSSYLGLLQWLKEERYEE